MATDTPSDVFVMLGKIDGTIEAIKTQVGELRQYNRNLEDKLIQAQQDLVGMVEQLRDSMATVSQLANQYSSMERSVRDLQQMRSEAWLKHDRLCERCASRLLQTLHNEIKGLREEIFQRMDIEHSKLENMGVIALAQRYWWQLILLTAFLASMIQIDIRIIKRLLSTLFGV